MKQPIIFLSFLICLLTLMQSGNAHNLQKTVQEDRSVSKFTGINVAGPFNIVITIGSKEEIRMEGDSELINRIETKVENQILRIGIKDRTRNWSWNSDRLDRIKIFVTVRSIKSLAISGSGTAKVEGVITGNSFSSVVSGSGNLTVQTDVKSYSAVISGSGSINASGNSGSADVSISGSGNFRGKDFKVGDADIRVSGSGGATIHAENHLEAIVSGSGTIRYSGNPHVDVTKSGSGYVSKF